MENLILISNVVRIQDLADLRTVKVKVTSNDAPMTHWVLKGLIVHVVYCICW